MEQEKISKFIKKIRKDNNLTQKELADKYGVTYQAVSKWENGINLPDTLLIKQISKDFKVSLDDIFEGEYSKQKRKKWPFLILILLLIIIIISIFLIKDNSNFKFKTINSNCSEFTISGSISYNKTKSAIFINEIEYCGKNVNEEYKKIDCTLYEKNNNVEQQVNNYNKEGPIKLEEFLKEVTFAIDNYVGLSREYQENSFYLIINATNKENKTIVYNVPLVLKENPLN